MSGDIYFTADTHFGHDKIVDYSSRPFSSLEQMTESLIASWNERVAPGDIVYHLGDFALSYGKMGEPAIDGILSRLNGQKWLIKGNHDRREVVNNPRWVKVLDYHEIKVDVGAIHKQRVVMSHYAFRAWNQSHRGSVMLHGHSHGGLPDIGGKIMDVGVDAVGYRPISFGEVMAIMNDRPVRFSGDHHE